MHKRFYILINIIPALLLGACMDYDPYEKERVGNSPRGLYIVNEGNFNYGSATLSYYDPETKTVENEVFLRTNAFKLGDVGQSMTIHDGKGYIVVNNSGIVFVIDPDTFEYIGEINGITSPRYVHIVSEEKGYITDLYAYSIAIFDPGTLEVTGRIPTGKHASTEQMIQYKNYVFANCWSYDNSILVIDTDTDSVVDEITVGKQPTSLVIDKYGRIWTVTDGGYAGSSFGHEEGKLFCIDPETRSVIKTFTLSEGRGGSQLCIDSDGENIYFISKHVWKMNVSGTDIPTEPFLYNSSPNYWYGITIDPVNSDVYLADAINYTQSGVIYRYSQEGELLDSFKVGVMPGAFCFKGYGHE